MQGSPKQAVGALAFCLSMAIAPIGCGGGNSAGANGVGAPKGDSEKPGSTLDEQRRNEKNLEKIEDARRKAEAEERASRKALREAEDALADAKATGNRQNEGAAMCEVAIYRTKLGDASSARELWRRGAAILKELGDTEALQRCISDMHEACRTVGVSPFDESARD